MVRWLLVCTLVGCIHDNLVTCGDQLCPAGSLCDAANGQCADPSGLSLPNDVIDLQVACGATSMSTLPFRNVSSHSIDVSIAATVPGVSASPALVTLAPGEEADVQLVATAPSESIPGVVATGNLVVAVDGNRLLGRQLRLSTNGALITASEDTVDFGESSIPASPIVRTFTLVNTGNADAMVTPTAPAAPYSLASAGAITLGAGGSSAVGVSFQPLDGSFPSELALAFSSNTCQPPPTSIALSGVGTGDAILVDHLVLDFGSSNCDMPMPVALPLTFTNEAATAQQLGFTISGGRAFGYSTDPAPLLPPGPSMTTINVTRSQLLLPQSIGVQTSTLTVAAPALATPTLVTLKQTIVSPLLVLSMGSFTFNYPKMSGTQQTVAITNQGNAVANVTVSPSSVLYPGTTYLGFSPSSFQIPPQGMAIGTVSFTSGTVAIPTTTLSFTFSAVGSCSGTQTLTVTFSVQ
jgi:hypothetical protein